MSEYTFDVKLWAVARVEAATEQEARAKLLNVVDCIDVGFEKDGVKLTEASSEGEFDLIEDDPDVDDFGNLPPDGMRDK